MRNWISFIVITFTILLINSFFQISIKYDNSIYYKLTQEEEQNIRRIDIFDKPPQQKELQIKRHKNYRIGQSRNIAYVHVGKTGGTSVACLIRKAQEGYKIRRSVCERVNRSLDRLRGKNESHISQQVVKTYHCQKDQIYEEYSSYLVSARDPIDRFVSWYMYQHPRNDYEEWGKNDYLRPSYKVFLCYPQLDQLVTHGLRAREEYGDINQNLSANDYCKRIAKNCITGRDKGCRHMYHNYQWYLDDILSDESKEFYVVRTEHQDYDWKTINAMLGDNANTENQLGLKQVSQRSNRYTGELKVNSVNNRTMSKEGINNICFVLCKEIKTYKKLLFKALNLNGEEREKSIQNIANICPLETSYISRDECV